MKSKVLTILLIASFIFSTAVFAKTKKVLEKSEEKKMELDNEVLKIKIDIPFQKFILPNGLTLIVSEDHKAPIVAVDIWYHVGSKNEKVGKTGFAHLFEHLMFNGSEHHNDEYFKPYDNVGVSDINGTTQEDRTNYFETVPNTALDMTLWLESDRMGYLLGVITQEKLDEQRGVVINEMKQYENRPYGKVWTLLSQNTYPSGHPYSWPVIGYEADLKAASLTDVHEWFKTYYGAANTTVVIAGDVDAKEVAQKVEKYFGKIPAGPVISKHTQWVSKMTGTHRQVLQDNVPQEKIYKVWNIPEWGKEANHYLALASQVFGNGKNSRLYKRLVYDDKSATGVGCWVEDREIGSSFVIVATVQPDGDVKKVEKAINEELVKFINNGPSEKELQRVKVGDISTFVRGLEQIGGWSGKTEVLMQNQVYGGSPDYYKTWLENIGKATPKEIQKVAKEWLSDGVYILDVVPVPEYKTAENDVDRSKLPEVKDFPKIKFPKVEKVVLSNGLKVVVANYPSAPVVDFELIVDAGYAADKSIAAGVADFTASMIDEGTKNRESLQISEELELLGAQLGSYSQVDISCVSLSTLKISLDKSLDIFADVILNATFPQKDFDRLQKQYLASIEQEKTDPASIAYRVMPGILYGREHPYGFSYNGSGTENSISNMKREDLVKFYDTWYGPNNSTLLVVGDITINEIQPKIEKLFASWKIKDVPKKEIADVSNKSKSQIYLVDRPNAQQSVILAGLIVPSTSNPDEIAMDTANQILGGDFTARINMNLRENKHWTYGARSFFDEARGQRQFIVRTPVQTDKTKESMAEIKNEYDGIIGLKPATTEELIRVQNGNTRSQAGNWETMQAISDSIVDVINYNLPENYYDTYADKLNALNLADISRIAKEIVLPDKLVWVVVGDLKKIEAGIRELNFGEVVKIDADGNTLK